MTDEVDKIFNEITKELEENVQEKLNNEYDYLLTFSFGSEFEKKQSQHLLERLFCLLPGTTYEIGNSYEANNISYEYNSELQKIIYFYKYSAYDSDKPKRNCVVYFAFNVAKPTYKWINSINILFNRIAYELNISFNVNGIAMSDAHLQKENYYKFGYFGLEYISKQEDKELRRQIEYTKATRKSADAIALAMITYTPNGFATLYGVPQEQPYLKRFDISYAAKTINIPMTYFTSEIYKEAILNTEIVPSIAQHNSILKSNVEDLRIEFIQIYESDERYIFVALQEPDKPRDSEDGYNFKYFYYTFWVDKGNYLTDALKLRKTLVNVFGEQTGLNIEKEIKEQQR